MKTTKKIMVVDIEATCWDGAIPRGQQSEIIEIGICVLDTVSGEVTGLRGILVKPERSEVSDFCTGLTTITQEMLDRDGVSFKEACRILTDEYKTREHTWASYGAYDEKMFRQQCRELNMPYPFGNDHINVKKLFAEKKKLSKAIGMAGALHILNLPLVGTHHRGVDDAGNIAGILQWAINN
jgi:inhibitor of KinA sporulation pathway (predicted exonuclease)